MNVFGVLRMIGGLALFLYGMNTMGDGLTKLSGGRMERILEKLTSKRIMALLLGTAVTAVIQSSSATTVMVVGFVNSGIMKLTQAVGIIMGANIGTTITSWLLSLAGIEGSSIWIKLLKPSSFSPVLGAVGVIMIMGTRGNNRRKDIGSILIGFAILMFGMETMGDAVAPLADNSRFTSILTMFSNPILGMLAGALLTAAIQSSSASVGILQALCATGAVGYGTAIPIIMGQNIGTCITAIISSVGASKNAKRASMIHLYFNLIGTVFFMVLFYVGNYFLHYTFLDHAANAAGIAAMHTLFNVGCTLVLFPFGNGLVKLAQLTIPDKEEALSEGKRDAISILDERFLEQPGFAIEICKEAAAKMAGEVQESLNLALDLLFAYSETSVEKVGWLEGHVDQYEDALGTYLVKLNNKDLSQGDSRSLSMLLHTLSDFQRISDHAVNIRDFAVEMKKKELQFSAKAQDELAVYSRALRDIVDKTISVFNDYDILEAKKVEPLKQVINELNIEIRSRHVSRLRKGKCTIELGLILQELLTDMERVSDHCSNIAVYLTRIREDGFDTHGYLAERIEGDQSGFYQEVLTIKEKYQLPENKSA